MNAINLTFTILAFVFLLGGPFLAIVGLIGLIAGPNKDRNESKAQAYGQASILLVLGLLVAFLGYWLQTHRIVPTQQVAVGRATVSQKLYGPYGSGLAPKPFLGKLYNYPGSTLYERCEKFYPALQGGYEIEVQVCWYLNARQMDWLAEIELTGQLEAGRIMDTWRNLLVGRVSEAVKDQAPEAVVANRGLVEEAIREAVKPWFAERDITLESMSLTYWNFTSAEVATEFDKSIAAQRKVAEQKILYNAAVEARNVQTYEAETAALVADQLAAVMDSLGIVSDDAKVQWLWVDLLSKRDRLPDVIILPGTGSQSAPVALPLDQMMRATGTMTATTGQ